MGKKGINFKCILSNLYLPICICFIVLGSSFYAILYSYFDTEPINAVVGFTFPILNFAILVSSLFVYGGKYKNLLFLFSASFSIFFNIKQISIGSLFSYSVLMYVLLGIINLIKHKKILDKYYLKRIAYISIFSAYALILCFILSGFGGFVKMFSQCGYLAFIFIFICTEKNASSIKTSIIVMALGLLLSNILSCFILYILKGDIAINFLKTFMSDVYVKGYTNSNISFRYPGLFGDPNYLGFNTILLTILFAANFKQFRHKILALALFVSLHLFAIIGMSKNYLIALVIIALVLLLRITFNNKYGIYYFLGTLVISLILFVALEGVLLPTIKRFVFLDTREGFLNAITTERSTLVSYYLSEFLRRPSSFIIGNGIWKSMLDSGSSSHNIYISLFWYFGLFGTLFYILYFCSLLNFKVIKKDFYSIVFLFVVAFYGLSLDFSTNAIFYFFCFSLFGVYVKNLAKSYIGKKTVNDLCRKENRYEFYKIDI